MPNTIYAAGQAQAKKILLANSTDIIGKLEALIRAIRSEPGLMNEQIKNAEKQFNEAIKALKTLEEV